MMRLLDARWVKTLSSLISTDFLLSFLTQCRESVCASRSCVCGVIDACVCLYQERHTIMAEISASDNAIAKFIDVGGPLENWYEELVEGWKDKSVMEIVFGWTCKYHDALNARQWNVIAGMCTTLYKRQEESGLIVCLMVCGF